jgi:hypothetical protein
MGMTGRGFALVERAGMVYRHERDVGPMITLRGRQHCLLAHLSDRKVIDENHLEETAVR